MGAFVNAETINGVNIRRVALDPSVYGLINTPIPTSYNILMPRLFNLSYADFCRMARDKYNATLQGRNGGYIIFYFKNSKDCDKLVNDLNKRWILWQKNK